MTSEFALDTYNIAAENSMLAYYRNGYKFS